MFNLNLEKAEEPEIKLPTSVGSSKKQESSRKKFTSAWLHQSLDCVDHNKLCGKFFKRWEYKTILPAFWKICMQVKKKQLELDMEQQTGSKQGKDYVKVVYCHPAYLPSRKSTSREMSGWKKLKLESILLGEISVTSVMQMTHT